MKKIKVCVHGLGNIGKYVVEALEATKDMECIGVIRRKSSIGKQILDLRGVLEFDSIENLLKKKGAPEVCLVCTPSRHAFSDDSMYLSKGISTVDSFDIHGEVLGSMKKLDKLAKESRCVSIISAGWDPGTDSVFRALFEAMSPVGTTFTNFGRGMSMGHSVAARAIKGVEDAVSITIPIGGGRHARLVYVVLEKGENIGDVTDRISKDDYFSHDPLDVREVADKHELARVCDASHGVLMERTGASGLTPNQKFSFDMRINNPALTAQVMVSCARAALRLPSHGCYTMIDIPPVYYLECDRDEAIKKLV